MTMEYLVSFDLVIATFVTCVVLREVFVLTLPDSIAGPGGWLVDTGRVKSRAPRK